MATLTKVPEGDVLLVEDNPGDRDLVAAYLEDLAWGLVPAGSLAEAVDKLSRETFRVVLLDLGLPDSTGLDTFRRLSAAAPAVPVVVLTGLGDDRIGLEALRIGAQDYLVKGQVDAGVLQRSVRYAIERKRAADDRARLEAQLRGAQKMDAIGNLAGGIAHDFNNLLTAILGWTDFALEAVGSREPLRDDLLEIRKAGERAAALTRQLLAFGRRQLLQPRSLDLNQVVLELEKMLRRIVGEDLELKLELAPGLGLIRADPGQLEQVLMNLVVNARDAMPAGGKLTLRTAEISLEEDLEQGEGRPGPQVMIEVTDTGCGMDRQTQERIFEPFFTTKEQGKGTGLGLATVYGIVKQSGGSIRVRSEPGHGSSFQVYLPLESSDAMPATRASTAAPASRGNETILLVEDEDHLRAVVARRLQAAGYTVLVAANGPEALQLAEAHRGSLELVVSDVVMPRMSGREMAERLTALRPGFKLLYMSGYVDDAIVRHGVLEPGVNFLGKPFSADALTRKVREVLDS
jgi:signal transduction histidine kinase